MTEAILEYSMDSSINLISVCVCMCILKFNLLALVCILLPISCCETQGVGLNRDGAEESRVAIA